jgi:hypothetical protein
VGYDVRSSGGKRAGALISARLDEALTECRRVRIEAMQDGSAISPKGWSCIAGIFDGPPWLCGVLLEPGFLDAPEHATLWDSVGLARIGQAVADGVLDYLEG